MNESATAVVLLCSLRYHGSGPRRQMTTTWPEPPGISRPEGSEETDDFNAEGLQVAQGKKGLPGR